jgi:hypothetical protein
MSRVTIGVGRIFTARGASDSMRVHDEPGRRPIVKTGARRWVNANCRRPEPSPAGV